MKKRIMALLLAGLLLSGCGGTAGSMEKAGGETRFFVDSLGRQVEIPEQIDRVALSGAMGQIVLFPLCPDQLVGLGGAWSEDAAAYLDEKYIALPKIGQLRGGKGELNLETLLAADAQIVIDVGEPKESLAEELDSLQDQTGLPFVHITVTTQGTGEAYRALGELLGMEERAETLAVYCDRIYAQTVALADKVEKREVVYLTGAEGSGVIAKGAYHAEVLDLLSENVAVMEKPSSKGLGNEVDLEQIMAWDPEVILFSPDGGYDEAGQDPAWQTLRAVRNGTYYEVPFGPYNWMGFPPSVQRYLGMLWMGELLYPEQVDYDLWEEVREYYKLFYHCELTREQYDALVENSIGKRG